ncbi:hypothetical protein ACQPX6_02410 [Actinomycetospora sp. CA-101289]|uniref:hypothetical protein n=1 Tax=Actinomycetospora sp. CA-101289 TaxID=3239893 RepID=UPI003D9792D8
MAERDMTGEDRPDRVGVPDEGGLVRRRGDHPRIGRLGFEGFGEDLGGLAGGGGDLANLPPWSVRDDATDRPDRDPVALAAWRRVAERRRLRASGVTGEQAAVDPAPVEAAVPVEPVEPVEVEAPVVEVEVPVVDDGPDLEDLPALEDLDEDLAEVEPEPEPVAPPVSEAHDPQPGPAERPTAAPAARGGSDPRPGTPPRTETGGRHEVLLSLAGRLDDDALTSVRELVAVEDDAAAAELLGGSLLAAGVGVTPREHAVLGRWFASSRVDPELVDALPRDPEADRRDEHRFSADPPAGTGTAGAGDVVARAAARLPGVARVRQSWRTTPAGTAPGPVPHRVVLVETHSADDCEHVAHHVAHAARELGAVSVEVFAAGAELPAYHRAAVRAARPLGAGPVGTSTPWTAAASDRVDGPAESRVVEPRPAAPAPPARRTAEDEVPPFGVPVAPSRPAAPVPEDVVRAEPAEEVEPAVQPEPPEEEYRTVAAAGRDPLERPDRAGPDPEDLEPPMPEPVVPEPVEETVEPPAPAELDPDTTAERIAALWRTPPPDEILSDEHPLSSWTDSPLGVSFGPDGDGSSPAVPERTWEPVDAGIDMGIDMDAATGDIPIVDASSPSPAAYGVDGAAPESSMVNGARLRRSRHSRSETGEFAAQVDGQVESPPPYTNGHHHGPESADGVGDAVTEPVHRPAPSPAPTSPTPTPPRPSSGPDSVDSQLSDRERELLARLHEELASRERLEAHAPDPLTGRPSGPPHGMPPGPPGSEDTTAPRPRPTGPHPGPRPPGPPPPSGGSNGHVNGHGLPRRGDHDGEDGTPRDG